MARISISVTRRSRNFLAPEAIFFRANVRNIPGLSEADTRQAYDPSFHRLIYVWDFGDPGAASDKVVNLPRVHNDLNRGYGKEVAHVFTRPGRYTIGCRVFTLEGRFLAEDTEEIAVADPESFFAGIRTVLVDPAGRGDPTRYPDAQIATTPSEALAWLDALGTDGRILLKRGQRYDIPERLAVAGQVPSFRLGAWGRGARPVLAAMRSGEYDNGLLHVTNSFAGDAVIEGVGFRGLWDSTTETGRQIGLYLGLQTNDKYHLLTDCSFDAAGTAVRLSGVRPETRSAFTLHNCDITNWGDYGLHIGRMSSEQRNAILGCAIHQHRAAMMGGGSIKDGQRNQHGPIRVSNGGQSYIACSDLFSRNGWTASVGADQPCLRWHSNTGPARSAGIVERVAMEGGFAMIAVDDATGAEVIYGTHLVIEKCLLVGTARTRKGIGIGYGGTTVRNCLYIQPDRPLISERWTAAFYGQLGRQSGFVDPDWPVEVYSNTVVNHMSDAHRNGTALRMAQHLDGFERFAEENNIFAAPNAQGQQSETPHLRAEPMRTVGGRWQSRYAGPRYQDRGSGAQLELDQRFATPDGTVFAYSPEAHSPVRNSAMGLWAGDDFFGRWRDDAAPDRGAIEG